VDRNFRFLEAFLPFIARKPVLSKRTYERKLARQIVIRTMKNNGEDGKTDFLSLFPPERWTYGAEHEFGDWDTRLGLPEGFYSDRREKKCANGNGIAASPAYPFGGEVNTPPTPSPEEQGEALIEFLLMHPAASVNYRSAMHGHVRVPGLIGNLPALKRLNAYASRYGQEILDTIEPYRLNPPTREQYSEPVELKGALRRWKHRQVSQGTILSPALVRRMAEARSAEEFFRTAKPPGGWQFFRRPAVNLFRIFPETARDHTTGTIEFRHFPGTRDPEIAAEAMCWCRDYLILALSDTPPGPKLAEYRSRGLLPMPFPRYEHDKELIFRRTCAKDGRSLADIRAEIERLFRAGGASDLSNHESKFSLF
jgi:hypothetical protein